MRFWFRASCGLLPLIAQAVDMGNPYGVANHMSINEPPRTVSETAKAIGLGWLRTDWRWHSMKVRTADKEWNFARFDECLAEAGRLGMNILPILFCPPADYPQDIWNHLDGWREYVRVVTDRYRDKFSVVEIWNEENYGPFWYQSLEPDPAEYLPVLRASYEEVKKTNPEIQVALGGTARIPHEYLAKLYKLGAGRYFDVMNIHPYTHPQPPEGVLDVQIEKLRDLMAEHGDGKKPIWITECGWPSNRGRFRDVAMVKAMITAAMGGKDCRAVYADDASGSIGDGGEAFIQAFRELLPDGATAAVCGPDELIERLSGNEFNLVVNPFEESYCHETQDAIVEFVKRGGVFAIFGGMPLWSCMARGDNGVAVHRRDLESSQFAERLRIDRGAWFLPGWNVRESEPATVTPALAATGYSADGISCARFVSDKLLKPGDRMTPYLISTDTNGEMRVGAALFEYGDMGGKVLTCGVLRGGYSGGYSEETQAKMLSRMLGISFAEGVERFFAYELQSVEADLYDPESHFGICHSDYARKPAAEAYAAFVAARPAGSVQDVVCKWRDNKHTRYAPQWTRPDGVRAGMLWKVSAGTVVLRLPFDSEKVMFSDMFGKPLAVRSNGRVYAVPLSNAPVYFQGGKLEYPNHRIEIKGLSK